jgi:hypothetical protein
MLLTTYLSFMIGYIESRPFVPPTQYNERQWLAFRKIFLRVYRAPSVSSPEGRLEINKFQFGLTKAGASDMKITKTSAVCFVPGLKEDEEIPANWVRVPVNRVGLHGLGVGAYAWWGEADKVIAINSPQKKVRSY